MKKLFVLLFCLLMLGVSTPALAKVCYKCTEHRPARYVCANKDTFRARKAARKVCNWKSYTSTCNCWKWVKPKQRSFWRYALERLRTRR